MSTGKRIVKCFQQAWPRALRSAWWMIRMMLPISLAVMFLQYFGLLNYIGQWLTPVFKHIGLPGESALVYITSYLLSIYAAIAVIGTMALDMREITILAIMCLISHNMIIETTIQKKTGSSVARMIIIRTLASFIGAVLLNFLLPETTTTSGIHQTAREFASVQDLFTTWLSGSFLLSIKVISIVIGLMFLQQILEEFGFMNPLSKVFRPLMKPLGLSEKTSFLWIIANAIGLTYGSAIMIDQVENGKILPEDADMLNHHVAINHSLLEDTLLFVAIGVPAFWITIPRIGIAMVFVWEYRLEKKFRKT
jgi:hypothetical protein